MTKTITFTCHILSHVTPTIMWMAMDMGPYTSMRPLKHFFDLQVSITKGLKTGLGEQESSRWA